MLGSPASGLHTVDDDLERWDLKKHEDRSSSAQGLFKLGCLTATTPTQ
jgi:hypothetical protein